MKNVPCFEEKIATERRLSGICLNFVQFSFSITFENYFYQFTFIFSLHAWKDKFSLPLPTQFLAIPVLYKVVKFILMCLRNSS